MNIVQQLKAITNEKNIFVNEPMKKHTTFQTGGPADFFVVPETKEEVQQLLRLDIPKTIIGNGSNLLVRDGGIRGMVIKVALNHLEVQEDKILAEAGCMLAKLSQVAYQHELTGLEFACGIPGTLGGALYMNAGAYGNEIGNLVMETEAIDANNQIVTIKDHEFGYRSSIFQKENYVILSSRLQLKKGDQESIKGQMDCNRQARREKQPIDKPSAGSTFKRPKEGFAGKYIEDAGLKGYSIGGAMISDLHAGFIINTGNATSQDILDLMEYVQEKVNEKFGVMLEPEVKIIGSME